MNRLRQNTGANANRRQRRAATVLIALSLVIVGTAERDLARRTDAEVRGSRTLWRLLSLNALGAIAYLVLGRARPSTSVPPAPA